MEQEKIDTYIITNKKYFPSEKMLYLKNKLLMLYEEKFARVSEVKLLSPTTSILVSVFLGVFGIDRFMLGDTGIEVLKLLTGGLFGVFTMADWFMISGKTKFLNYNNIIGLIKKIEKI